MKLVLNLFAAALLVANISCSKKAPIKVTEPKIGTVESTVSTVNSGTVEAIQQAILTFSGNGKVEKIYVKLGDVVKQGQLIAQTENRDAQALLEQASRDFETSKKLMSEGLISKAALDESKKAFEMARSTFDHTQMIAPFSGMISELNLQVGENPTTSLTSTNKVAVRIVDLKPRFIKGNIDEMDLAKVKVGAAARIRIQSVQAKAIEAKVSKVIPFISTSKEQERTAQVELQPIDTNLQLPVGASADIEIVVAAKTDALTLPARAIFGVSKQRHLYRVVNDRLVKTEIEVGLGNYESMEIVKGISLSEIVALPTEGVDFSDGLKVQTTKVTWP